MKLTRTPTPTGMPGTTKTVFAAGLAVFALAVGALAPVAAQQPPVEPFPAKLPTASSPPKLVTKAPYSPDPVPRRGFNVVLLLGDMQGGDAQDNIPVAARKALADMKDFLPYKNYRLLDTQWIIGGTAAAVTRMRGVDDQEYELELHASPTMMPGTAAPSSTAISVRFRLREPGEADGADTTRTPFHPKEMAKADPASLEVSREIFQLERERDDLQIQVEQKRANVEIGMANTVDLQRMQQQLTAVKRRIADLRQQFGAAAASSNIRQQANAMAAAPKASGRTVIDTSFRMDDGETVVVGTSRVKGGGKALIALLTATADRKGSTK